MTTRATGPADGSPPKEQSPLWNRMGSASGRENYPVAGVTWDQATAYCVLLSARTGKKVTATHRGRMGEGRARRQPAPLPVGQPDRSDLCLLRQKPLRVVGFYDRSKHG